MRLLVQRVCGATVRIGGRPVGGIGKGLLVLVGVGRYDGEYEAQHMAYKLSRLRIFDDTAGRMNLDIASVKGDFLVVSQFTLYADCRGGHRPGYTDAAPSDEAKRIYMIFVDHLRALGHNVSTGEFQAEMQVELINDGPVTVWMDSQQLLSAKKP